MQRTAEKKDHVVQEPQSSNISCLHSIKYPQFLVDWFGRKRDG